MAVVEHQLIIVVILEGASLCFGAVIIKSNPTDSMIFCHPRSLCSIFSKVWSFDRACFHNFIVNGAWLTLFQIWMDWDLSWSRMFQRTLVDYRLFWRGLASLKGHTMDLFSRWKPNRMPTMSLTLDQQLDFTWIFPTMKRPLVYVSWELSNWYFFQSGFHFRSSSSIALSKPGARAEATFLQMDFMLQKLLKRVIQRYKAVET